MYVRGAKGGGEPDALHGKPQDNTHLRFTIILSTKSSPRQKKSRRKIISPLAKKNTHTLGQTTRLHTTTPPHPSQKIKANTLHSTEAPHSPTPTLSH